MNIKTIAISTAPMGYVDRGQDYASIDDIVVTILPPERTMSVEEIRVQVTSWWQRQLEESCGVAPNLHKSQILSPDGIDLASEP